MRKKRLLWRIIWVIMVITVGGDILALAITAIPNRILPKNGVTVYQNEKAMVDASNLEEGYLRVAYTGGKQVRIKVQITKDDGVAYTYNLNQTGVAETFPLTEGDGAYTIKVFENTTGDKYAQAYSVTVTLQLRDSFLPFLYPNQYVNFTEDSQVVSKAAELTEDLTSDLEKVTRIYHFVVGAIRYDYALAQTVQSGYLPDVDKVLASGKGICFDYAALMSAMLRSQGIPCKLVVGFADKAYHAWIRVHISEVGWVDHLIYFDGVSWTLLDPTFASSGKDNPKILEYIGDGTNYTQKYAY